METIICKSPIRKPSNHEEHYQPGEVVTPEDLQAMGPELTTRLLQAGTLAAQDDVQAQPVHDSDPNTMAYTTAAPEQDEEEPQGSGETGDEEE